VTYTVILPRETPTARVIRIPYTVTADGIEFSVSLDTIKMLALAPSWLLAVNAVWKRLLGPLVTVLLDSDTARDVDSYIWKKWGPKIPVSVGGTTMRSE